MPWLKAAPIPIPEPPPPAVYAAVVPRIPMAPAGHADASRAWSRDGAQMTPQMHQNTRPYLEAVMRLGGDYKLTHATDSSAEKVASLEKKLLGRYMAANPMPENASLREQEQHAQGALAMLQNFRERLPMQKEVHKATRELRNEFRHHTPDTYTPAVQQDFEQKYAALRETTGRQQPSLLEQALPQDSPLRTKLDPLTGGLRDPATGLYANLVQIGEGAEQKNVLVFGGTKTAKALTAQLQADAGQFLGGVPKAYQQADQLTALVNQSLQEQGQTLETAGHSLGGGLAHYAALKNGGIQATCFNAAALGGGCKASIGANLSQAKDNVRHINVDGDLVGDGIGKLRVPAQKAADGVQKQVNRVTSFADDNLTNALAIGKAAQQRVSDLTKPVRDTAAAAGKVVTDVAGNIKTAATDLAGEIKTAATDLAADVKETVTDLVNDVKTTAGDLANDVRQTVGSTAKRMGTVVAQSPVGQGLHRAGEAVSNSPIGQLAAEVGQTASQLATSAGELATEAKQGVDEVVTQTKTSVRDMLKGTKQTANQTLTTLKEGAGNLVQDAGERLKNSAAGKQIASAHESAVNAHENLGFGRGKLAIPHQYGGCITLPNNGAWNPGKNNPLSNHLVGAISKAYDRNAQQQAAVRNQVSIGQQRAGGGRGHGV